MLGFTLWKDSATRFLTWDFFMDLLTFFKKFAEIVTAQGTPPVSMTPVAN